MYDLLHHYSFRDQLLRRGADTWSKQLRTIIRPHLYEPQQELELQRAVGSLSVIEQDVAVLVGQQYEESPYPR
jgi:hypothetical protein